MCEELEDEKDRLNCLSITETPDGKIIDFYLYKEIESLLPYIPFLRAVEQAKENDTICLHINCYGGDLDVAFNIIDVLNLCKAHINISVEGPCASAASMILLTGDNWRLCPHSYVMVHAWTAWRYGKKNEIDAQHDFDKAFLEKKFREIYKDFMSEEELDRCLRGEDFYFDPNETSLRLQKYQADVIKKQKAINEATAKYQGLIDKEIQEILDGKISEEPPKKSTPRKKTIPSKKKTSPIKKK